ncbi:NAD(P)-dependent oxidoreductase [Paracidobacterium acidisoli]|uniref:NAD(P)-dependent oxidoreductase n=1 Tax=Paracidobacterium acidisoli TaxID=2303751 RepID=A0A372IQM0_9BACT|nr:NAD(P)-dependent oxidoreductase [Paracidobacterium acidisoli]MBT9331542.1 NAD(P)-dependent oxidoreductase [Paracidobacterium acidisoli]
MEQTHVAILGLGLMGGGMAGNLLAAGYPLTVYNRTPEKAQPLAAKGARVAKTPAEAAAGAQVIISMVSDDNVSREIWLGRDGALAAAAAGTILIECSTLTPAWIDELDASARRRSLDLIDAPVTGSKPQAASGQLLFLAGGSASAIHRVTPLLQTMGRGVLHLGPIGSGARMKLINNFLCGVQAASLAEAIGLIERSGLNADQALQVLTEGAPGSPLVKTLSARMMARDYQPNFAARLMAKDLTYAISLGKACSLELSTAGSALRDYSAAIDAGHGDEDISAVVETFRKS